MNSVNYQPQSQIHYQNNMQRPSISDINERVSKEEGVPSVIEEELKSQSDDTRQAFVATIGHQSKQTQAEIYLSVALEQDVDLSNQNKTMLESLHKTQEQNNTIKAYAAYQEAGVAPRVS